MLSLNGSATKFVGAPGFSSSGISPNETVTLKASSALLRLNLDKLKIDRDEFSKKMQERGIGVSMHFIPLFHFSYWQNLDPDFRKENFPNAENQFKRTITLPLWPDMTDQMIYDTIEVVKQIGQENYGA